MAVPGRSGNETGGNVSANGGSAADDGILAKLKELQVQRGDDGVLRVRLSPEQVLILAVPENGETGVFLVSSVEDNDGNLIFQQDVGALSGVGVDDVIGGGGNDGDSDDGVQEESGDDSINNGDERSVASGDDSEIRDPTVPVRVVGKSYLTKELGIVVAESYFVLKKNPARARRGRTKLP